MRHDFPLYTLRKTRDTPSTNRIFPFLVLISERDYLEGLLEYLLCFLKTPEVRGVGNKGANIMNYVALSVIYQIWDLVNVFCELIVNPPGLYILGTK